MFIKQNEADFDPFRQLQTSSAAVNMFIKQNEADFDPFRQLQNRVCLLCRLAPSLLHHSANAGQCSRTAEASCSVAASRTACMLLRGAKIAQMKLSTFVVGRGKGPKSETIQFYHSARIV
jgi:hypothetical protein